MVKNLLVGDDVTYERKIREMIVASRVEQALSKDEILELYLNSIYLGRGSWGVEMAAQSYFGKPAKELTLEEGALLAGLTKGPNYYNPDRHPDRAHERLAYVLSRMQEDGVIGPGQASRRLPSCRHSSPTTAAPRHRLPFRRPARARGQGGGRDRRHHRQFLYGALDHQHATAARAEAALQEGLARYERSAGRVSVSTAPKATSEQAIRRIEAKRQATDKQAGLAAGAGERAAAALRRALDAGGGGREAERPQGTRLARRPARRPHPAALDRQRRRPEASSRSTTSSSCA